LRRLGWYGETAASRMLHPNRLRRNTHAGALRVTGTTHAPGSGCLNCHGRGPVPLVTHTDVGLRALRGLARAHVQEVQHAGLNREACCVISKYVTKLLAVRCAGLQRAYKYL
jgi:hypothetical protein